jgi:hypothetical protein
MEMRGKPRRFLMGGETACGRLGAVLLGLKKGG